MLNCVHKFQEKEYRVELNIGYYIFVICDICDTRRVIKWKLTCK